LNRLYGIHYGWDMCLIMNGIRSLLMHQKTDEYSFYCLIDMHEQQVKWTNINDGVRSRIHEWSQVHESIEVIGGDVHSLWQTHWKHGDHRWQRTFSMTNTLKTWRSEVATYILYDKHIENMVVTGGNAHSLWQTHWKHGSQRWQRTFSSIEHRERDTVSNFIVLPTDRRLAYINVI